jgi:serine/threonine protein kinase
MESTIQNVYISRHRQPSKQRSCESINYEPITILQTIKKSKCSLSFIKSEPLNKPLLLKAFSYEDNQVSSLFQREARLLSIRHPHILEILDAQAGKRISSDCDSISSYAIMEIAPSGNFSDLVWNSEFPLEDKLVRTYFHQLINGIEFLHSQGIAHMNLKLKNLLLGENFTLKISDFKYSMGDGELTLTKGSKNFRAPELILQNMKNPRAADVYSMGIILFALKSGILPYIEGKKIQGWEMDNILFSSTDLFWNAHEEIKIGNVVYDRKFRELFLMMVKQNPQERATIAEIKRSDWYRGPIYTNQEVVAIMSSKF